MFNAIPTVQINSSKYFVLNRCLSTNNFIVGDLERLAGGLEDNQLPARDELMTNSGDDADPYGCRNHEIGSSNCPMVTRAEWGARPPKKTADPMVASKVGQDEPIFSQVWRN